MLYAIQLAHRPQDKEPSADKVVGREKRKKSDCRCLLKRGKEWEKMGK